MSIKVGDKITYVASRIDDGGIEVFSKERRCMVERVYQGDDGFAYAVRWRGKIEIILDTQVKP